MKPAQKSIKSFFSSSPTPSPFASPSNVLKQKPPEKNSTVKVKPPTKKKSSPKGKKDAQSPAEQVKKVVIAAGDTVDESDESPPSSPIKPAKRKRTQVFESDDSSPDTENTPSVTPKRQTAKLSKEFRSRLANRVQTPHPSKAKHAVEKTLTSPDLSNFSYKKRSCIEQSPTTPCEMSPSPPKPTNTPKPSPSPKESPKVKSPVKSSGKGKGPASKVKVSGFTLVSATCSEEYKPDKAGYNPVSDACWALGEDVPYSALAFTLKAIEPESKRLRITEILCNFLRSVCLLTPDDLHLCVYLCTNKVAPAYAGLELGIGDTVVMRALSEACGSNVKQLREKLVSLGDLGLVAEVCRSNQKMMTKPKPLTVKGVFSTLHEITTMSGNQSQSKKVSLIKKLLVSCQGPEARYLTRSVLGKLRVGLAEQTVLVSLAHATLLSPPGVSKTSVDKKNSEKIKGDAALIVKTCYCEFPDYDHLIKVIRDHGVMNAEKHCRLHPGIPVKPMLAHPTKGIPEVLQRFEGAEFTCEYKYDGERAQVQYNDEGEMKIFSRNQENNTTKYPDVINRIGNIMVPGTKSFILDCEIVAWDLVKKQILPFQILTTRKRKDADVKQIKVQVCLFGFDLLFLNGESLVRKTFRERRALLHSAFKVVEGEFIFATAKDYKDCDIEEIQEFLEESIKGQCEGLMVKTLDKDATYEISKRSHNWLKVKKDYLEGVGDSLDLAVIGAYNGKGKRSGVYGGFLLACYDPDLEQFQAVCKIGTGFTDEDLASHFTTLSDYVISDPKSYYSYPESVRPDVWLDPSVVWEVKCADLSLSPIYTAAVGAIHSEKGISLRFPRFIRIRDDKSSEDATSAAQVAELYSKQENKQETEAVDEADFY